MKKIAVAAEEMEVCQHFGHCPYFMIFDVEGEEILKQEQVENPGHQPGFLPRFLNDLGVKAIIAGCMGSGALDLFNQNGIDVIVGASGNVVDAVKAYLNGTLKSTGVVCSEHEHEHKHEHEHNHGECKNHGHGEGHHCHH